METINLSFTLNESKFTQIKKILENLFGQPPVQEKQKPITERIKTYEDACAATGEMLIDEADLKAKGFTDDEIIYRKLKTITAALNEGKKINMLDVNQKKWQPVFKVDSASPSGFVFDFSLYLCSRARAGYVSRLCFKSEELSDYASKQFSELYINFIK